MIKFEIVRNIIIICFSMILFIISGCTITKSSIKTGSSEETSLTAPTTAEEEDYPVPEVKYTFLDTINRGNEIVLSDADFGKNERQNIKSSTVAALPEYRVQVFASNKIETVREQKKKLEKLIKEQIIIGYEAPYYKLYAGLYAKRIDAKRTLLKLKKLGYPDAWIVSTTVTPEN